MRQLNTRKAKTKTKQQALIQCSTLYTKSELVEKLDRIEQLQGPKQKGPIGKERITRNKSLYYTNIELNSKKGLIKSS